MTDATKYTPCAKCGRDKSDGVIVIRFVPVFGLPGASTPAVCSDTRDCAAHRATAAAMRRAEAAGDLEPVSERDRAWSEGVAMFAADEDEPYVFETSTEHDALQGVIPLDGDVSQGALL